MNTTVVRIQLDFPEDKVRELTELMGDAEITTRKDLFNHALSLLAWALKERQKGNIIVSMNENEGTYKELIMPPLEAAARKAASSKVSAKKVGSGRMAATANVARPQGSRVTR